MGESSHSSLAFLQNELLRLEGAAPSSAASGAIASTSSATLASPGDHAAHSEGHAIRQLEDAGDAAAHSEGNVIRQLEVARETEATLRKRCQLLEQELKLREQQENTTMWSGIFCCSTRETRQPEFPPAR